MLDDEQLAAIIEVGYEQRGIEFKSAGDRTDRAFLANVARAVLALSNQRDGGHLIVGLSEDGIDAAETAVSGGVLQELPKLDGTILCGRSEVVSAGSHEILEVMRL